MTDLIRCSWSGSDPVYLDYHDREWGVPVRDDHKQFEFLVLESAQAGLSWITILKRREGYRRIYKGFRPEMVARFDEDDIQSMLKDAGIIRNRKKIESSINNARRFLEISDKYGSFCNYIWGFTDGKQVVNHFSDMSEIPPNTALLVYIMFLIVKIERKIKGRMPHTRATSSQRLWLKLAPPTSCQPKGFVNRYSIDSAQIWVL